MKKPYYTSMFTLRKDGRYQGYWHELDRSGEPTGPRHCYLDKYSNPFYCKKKLLLLYEINSTFTKGNTSF